MQIHVPPPPVGIDPATGDQCFANKLVEMNMPEIVPIFFTDMQAEVRTKIQPKRGSAVSKTTQATTHKMKAMNARCQPVSIKGGEIRSTPDPDVSLAGAFFSLQITAVGPEVGRDLDSGTHSGSQQTGAEIPAISSKDMGQQTTIMIVSFLPPTQLEMAARVGQGLQHMPCPVCQWFGLPSVSAAFRGIYANQA